jgi:L-rhamnose mutarotase
MKKVTRRGVVRGFAVVLALLVGPASSHGEQKQDQAADQKSQAARGEKQKAAKQKCRTASKADAGAKRAEKRKEAREKQARAAAKRRPKSTKGGKVKRMGAVIELLPEKRDYYLKLHGETWPSVLEQVRQSNIRNYSIYLAELEGKLYLFAYYEYVGDDFEADMAKMADHPETQRWWKETNPCQKRLPGTPEGQQWLSIPEVFHTD